MLDQQTATVTHVHIHWSGFETRQTKVWVQSRTKDKSKFEARQMAWVHGQTESLVLKQDGKSDLRLDLSSFSNVESFVCDGLDLKQEGL